MPEPDHDHVRLVSVIDVADQLGVLKQTVFKVVRRLGITPLKRRDEARRNQLASFVTAVERDRIVEELRKSVANELQPTPVGDREWDDLGLFYLIQLEPEHDPERVKVGFTVSVAERLRTHRCSAPFATVVKTWPCRRVWERAAIDCVTRGAEQLHTEVFRVSGLDASIRLGDSFFDLMPVELLSDDEDDGNGAAPASDC